MDININQNLELNQKLTFTPELQQSVKILQMSSIDLQKYIDEEALENPLIEIESNYETLDYDEKLEKKLDWLNSIEEENRIYYQSSNKSKESTITIIFNESMTLVTHLLSQLNLLSLSPLEYKVAYYILESLNDNGYLTINPKDISSIIGIDLEIVEDMLCIVQSLEPIGVGARDLKECLILQLKNKNVQNQKIYDLINNYLDDLGKNKLSFIAKKMGINLEETKEMVTTIKSLNPRPGNLYNPIEQPRYVTPDIIVVKFEAYYEILLNDLSCPKFNINSYYKNTLTQSDDKEVNQYINKKMKQAMWVMNCIDQRNNTLKKVATAIVNVQKEFFDLGPGHLIPMKLEDIAKEIEMHVSTVSRAVHDKYLQCSWGIYELNYFFSIKITTSGKSNTTPGNIKIQIKNLIQNEDTKKPLSDQKLTDILNNKGVQISRRTVAKYRNEIGIPGRAVRREF